jgi:hypothetical protein
MWHKFSFDKLTLVLAGLTVVFLTCAPAGPSPDQQLIQNHLHRYPKMRMDDLYKLLHHTAMGSEHAVSNPAMAEDWMERELAAMGDGPHEPMIDTLGTHGRFVRIHLRPFISQNGDPDKLVRAFVQTANTAKPDTARMTQLLQKSLEMNLPWPADSLIQFYAEMRSLGYPAVHHSNIYKSEYRPAYRVISRDLIRDILPQ